MLPDREFNLTNLKDSSQIELGATDNLSREVAKSQSLMTEADEAALERERIKKMLKEIEAEDRDRERQALGDTDKESGRIFTFETVDTPRAREMLQMENEHEDKSQDMEEWMRERQGNSPSRNVSLNSENSSKGDSLQHKVTTDPVRNDINSRLDDLIKEENEKERLSFLSELNGDIGGFEDINQDNDYEDSSSLEMGFQASISQGLERKRAIEGLGDELDNKYYYQASARESVDINSLSLEELLAMPIEKDYTLDAENLDSFYVEDLTDIQGITLYDNDVPMDDLLSSGRTNVYGENDPIDETSRIQPLKLVEIDEDTRDNKIEDTQVYQFDDMEYTQVYNFSPEDMLAKERFVEPRIKQSGRTAPISTISEIYYYVDTLVEKAEKYSMEDFLIGSFAEPAAKIFEGDIYINKEASRKLMDDAVLTFSQGNDLTTKRLLELICLCSIDTVYSTQAIMRLKDMFAEHKHLDMEELIQQMVNKENNIMKIIDQLERAR